MSGFLCLPSVCRTQSTKLYSTRSTNMAAYSFIVSGTAVWLHFGGSFIPAGRSVLRTSRLTFTVLKENSNICHGVITTQTSEEFRNTHTQVYACFAFLYNLFTCILNILQYYSRRASLSQLDSIAGLGIEVSQLFSTQRGHRYSDNETNKREVRWISLMGILPHWSLGHSSTQAFCTEKRLSCRTAEGKLEHWASTRSWTTLPELVQSGVNWRISSALNSRGDEWLPADVKTQPPPGAQAQRAGTQ